jgi:hypothetical protein
MPIFHPAEPPGGSAALKEGLSKVFETATQVPTFRLLRRAGTIAHGPPHRVYTVGLHDLAERKLLSAAKDVSWNYPVFSDSTPVGEVEIGRTYPDRPDLAFKAFHRTPFTEATVAALDEAEKSASVAHADYEMRFLKIPSVYFAALWLHGPDDILVPLREPPGRLISNREYKELEVISALQPSVEGAIRFERQFERGEPV